MVLLLQKKQNSYRQIKNLHDVLIPAIEAMDQITQNGTQAKPANTGTTIRGAGPEKAQEILTMQMRAMDQSIKNLD